MDVMRGIQKHEIVPDSVSPPRDTEIESQYED